jgi:guanylate kinase
MKGKLFLIVGPSGSGKSSVMMGLKKAYPQYTYPLSATTRAMRPGEKDGDIYHFLTKETFQKGIEKGDFLEYAVVHQDNYYGLIKQPVLDALSRGETVVREVDIQGFDSIRSAIAKENLVTIFITAPSVQDLVDRIKARSQMPEEELKKRLESMQKEVRRAKDCDYMIENKAGELEKTIGIVADLIQKEMK